MLSGDRARFYKRLASMYNVSFHALTGEFVELAKHAVARHRVDVKMGSFAAWQAAFIQESVNNPFHNLVPVLEGYALHMGLSTSDTERFFAVVRRVVWAQRSHMTPAAEETAIRIALAGINEKEPTRAQLDACLRLWHVHCGESRQHRHDGTRKPRIGDHQDHITHIDM